MTDLPLSTEATSPGILPTLAFPLSFPHSFHSLICISWGRLPNKLVSKLNLEFNLHQVLPQALLSGKHSEPVPVVR